MKLLKGLSYAMALVTFISFESAQPAAAQNNSLAAATCQSMLSLSIPDTQVTSATVVAQTTTLPAHCRVVGLTHGEAGSNVGVEVRLPDSWNGKLLFTTRQGYLGAFPALSNAV